MMTFVGSILDEPSTVSQMISENLSIHVSVCSFHESNSKCVALELSMRSCYL